MGKKRRRDKTAKKRTTPPAHVGGSREYRNGIVDGRHVVPELFVAEFLGGRLTAEALLRPEGTIELPTSSLNTLGSFAIFHIAHNDFWFGGGIREGCWVFQRCESAVSVPVSTLAQYPYFLFSWTLESLAIVPGRFSEPGAVPVDYTRMAVRPTPPHLLRLARQQSLIPTSTYRSSSELLARVHAGLSFVQDKIEEMQSVNIFWDLRTEGNRIIDRTPKRERDLLPVFQALLSDHFLLAGIDVVPEANSSVGRLDFLFQGQVEGQGTHKICAEFKCAHSSDLIRGVEFQLPAYMRAHQTSDGTYCILDFQGEWFDEPADGRDFHQELSAAADRGWQDRAHPIKFHHFYLGRGHRSASRMKSTQRPQANTPDPIS